MRLTERGVMVINGLTIYGEKVRNDIAPFGIAVISDEVPSINAGQPDRTKIGPNVTTCNDSFTADMHLKSWEARADGSGPGSGLLVGSGAELKEGELAQFDVQNTELTYGDKQYRINIYGQSRRGVWTNYE